MLPNIFPWVSVPDETPSTETDCCGRTINEQLWPFLHPAVSHTLRTGECTLQAWLSRVLMLRPIWSLSHQNIERELWQIKRNLYEEIRTQSLGQNPFIGGKVSVPSHCNNGMVTIEKDKSHDFPFGGCYYMDYSQQKHIQHIWRSTTLRMPSFSKTKKEAKSSCIHSVQHTIHCVDWWSILSKLDFQRFPKVLGQFRIMGWPEQEQKQDCHTSR